MLLVLETSTFAIKDEHIRGSGCERFWRWRRTCLALKLNEVNMFGAGDEITRLAIETSVFDAEGECVWC